VSINSSIHFGLRVCGAVVFGLIGWSLADLLPYNLLPSPFDNLLFAQLVLSVVLGAAGILILPPLIARPLVRIYERIVGLSAVQIIASFMGLAAGLLIAALMSLSLSQLPAPFGPVLPFLAAVAFGSLGLGVMSTRYREVFGILNIKMPTAKSDEALPATNAKEPLLLDTSVIIDGRIADIASAGFVRGEMIVPQFVLNELQFVADSPDALRRVRGRRGLEVLKRLQNEQQAYMKFVDEDPLETTRVDEKLVMLGKKWKCPVITNDYNLNKVATLQGVSVLNINELANAVKTVLIPGETLEIEIIQEGKEIGQGVGYLEDGTMVVVEDGKDYLDRTIDVTVTKVLQTAAGRMIFAKP
jgi:uncharacterized protein YacL